MAAEGQRLVVLAGTLIDGTGADPLEKAAIVIEGGRFSQVGPQNKIKVDRKDGAVLDLSDRGGRGGGRRISASGTALCATGGGPVLDAPRRFVFEITGADEARRVVRKQLRAGGDFIKLFTTAGVPSGRPEVTGG